MWQLYIIKKAYIQETPSCVWKETGKNFLEAAGIGGVVGGYKKLYCINYSS